MTSPNRFTVSGASCKCRFCERCGCAVGLALREKLSVVLAGFKSVQMWTLTVDPSRFASPESAFRSVMSNKLIARLMRGLRKESGVGKHYFWVLECHKSGWPHWHLVIDAHYLAKSKVQEIWNRLGTGDSSENFGFVAFSKGKGRGLQNCIHAANYVTKYITKHPKDGWPEWIQNYTGRIRRFDHSRGIFKTNMDDKPKKPKESISRGTYKLKTSVKMRVDACGNHCALFVRSTSGWKRIGYAPVSVKALQEFFAVDGSTWSVPSPGVDTWVDLLIWSHVGRSDLPRCTIDEAGCLQVDEWGSSDLFDILDSAPSSFLSSFASCG